MYVGDRQRRCRVVEAVSVVDLDSVKSVVIQDIEAYATVIYVS